MVGQHSANPRVPPGRLGRLAPWRDRHHPEAAAPSPALPPGARLVPQLRPRPVDPPPALAPCHLNDKMPTWAHKHVAPQLPTHQPLYLFPGPLMAQPALPLPSQVGPPAPAGGVFAPRHANCLSFT